MATLQAEHVLMKQSIYVSDSLRTKQIDTLKLGISDIKSQLLNYSTTLKDCSFSTLSGIQNIGNSAASQLLQVEDRVRWLETVLNTDNVAVISKFSETLKTDLRATQNDRPPLEASDLIPTHTSEQCSFCDKNFVPTYSLVMCASHNSAPTSFLTSQVSTTRLRYMYSIRLPRCIVMQQSVQPTEE